MRRTMAAAVLLVLLLLSVVPFSNDTSAQTELPEWTFMVYLDADNNLEDAGIEDLNEMEEIGSTDDLNIVVQMDRAEGYDTTNGDWEGCRRFKVEKDLDRSTITSPELALLGEVNMGDPGVLVDFVRWSVSNFPAKKYALVLWDHGGAFRGVCYDEKVPGLPEGEYDMINMSDLHKAAEEIYGVLGNNKLDLCGFDACLMGEVAVMYELKDFVKVGVGSGYNEPGDGWPYMKILSPLSDDPRMDERELAKIIVHEYIWSYNNKQEDPQDYPMVTQAAFDLEKMDEVAAVLDRFAEELASSGPFGSLQYLLQIYQARKNCNSYDMANVFIYDLTGYPLYDVIDFTKLLQDYILSAFPKNELIRDLCSRVRTHIGPGEDRFMFYSEADRWHPDASGLSMYFPNKDKDSLSITKIPTTYSTLYDETSFAREHLWDEFLHAYYGIDPIEDSFPTIDITEPSFNSTFSLEDQVVIIRGTAYDREMVDRVEIRVDEGEWSVMPGISGQGTIGWIYQLEPEDLSPGAHRIEVRAWDRPVTETGGNVGKATAPVMTRINILAPPTPEEGSFTIPSWFVQGVIIMIIVGAIVLGVIIYRGGPD